MTSTYIKRDDIKQIEELYVDIHTVANTPDVTTTVSGITNADWEDALRKVLFLEKIENYHEVKGTEDIGGKLKIKSKDIGTLGKSAVEQVSRISHETGNDDKSRSSRFLSCSSDNLESNCME